MRIKKEVREESLAYFDSCYRRGTPPQSSTILTHLDSFQMICHGNKREGRVEPIYSSDWQNLMMMMALFIFLFNPRTSCYKRANIEFEFYKFIIRLGSF